MMTSGDPSVLLEGFIRHVTVLAQDESYQYLQGVLEENSTLKERNHILNITNDEIHRTISKIQQQLDNSIERQEEQSREFATLAEDKTLLEEKAASLESDAEKIQEQLNDNAEEISRLQAGLVERTAELQASTEELDSTKARLEEAQDECSKLEADIDCKDAEIKDLHSNVSDKNAEIGDLTSDLESIKAQLDQYVEDCSNLQSDLRLKHTDVEDLHAKVSDKDAEIDALTADLESTNTQLNQVTEDCLKVEAELETRGSEIEALSASLEKERLALAASQADVNSRESDIEALNIALEEEKSELTASRTAHEETTNELQSTRRDLETKNTRLGELNALSYKMKNPSQEQTNQQLHNMFALAQGWVESLFADDLEEAVFVTPASGTLWAKIRNHGRVNRIIPLPLSNTREAKRMRISAVLAILAWALAQYVFQPTYLLQCNELSDLLAGLADDDPVREHYLRSVLLPVLPSRQKANGKRRIEQVVAEVYAAISPVLPKGRQEEFRGSLETTCKQICGQWMRLQLLEEKIEPSFDAYDDEDWKLLSLPTFGGSDAGASTMEGSADANNDNAEESAIADDDQSQAVGDIENIAAVLWPSFLSFRGGESELLAEGFVLSKAQVKSAYNEEKVALLQGIHRAARQISRKDRTKSFVTNADEISTVKNFLPEEPGEEPPPPPPPSEDPPAPPLSADAEETPHERHESKSAPADGEAES